MAWFNPPTLQAGCVEGFGTPPAYAIHGVATPRRIWEMRLERCCRGGCLKNKRHDRLIVPAVPEKCGHGWPRLALGQGEHLKLAATCHVTAIPGESHW